MYSKSPCLLLAALFLCLLAPGCNREPADIDKLMAAVGTGNVDAVRRERDKGFDKDRLNGLDGKDVPLTPLHLAAMDGHTQVVALLLDRGVKPDLKLGYQQAQGATPLMMAAGAGHTDTVALLLARGADPNATMNDTAGMGKNGTTALDLACQAGHLDTANALLNGGANINGTGGVTPLQVAASAGQVEIVKFLISKGARVGIMDPGFARHQGHPEIAAILLKSLDPVSATAAKRMMGSSH